MYGRERRQEHRRLKETNADTWHKLSSFAAYPLPLDKSRFDNPDNDPRGPWKADPFDAPNIRENLTYKITNPNTGEEYLPPEGRCWRTEEVKYKSLLADGRIVFGKTGQSRPQLKVFYEEKKDFGEVPTSWFDGNTYGTSTNGTQELQTLFEGASPFDFPKPTTLLKALLELSTRDGDIVLDFFAGSGTLANAVIDFNNESKEQRKFVLVQLPEAIENKKFSSIADITKERVRRVIQKLNDEEAGQLPLGNAKQDRGFRVFKLSESNFKGWEASAPKDGAALVQQLEMHIDHIREGRTSEDILYEILLKSGFPLTTPVEKIEVEGKSAYSVASGGMLICLEKDLTLETIRAMAELKPQRVICLDMSFAGNDQLKANAVQIFKTKDIVFKTV